MSTRTGGVTDCWLQFNQVVRPLTRVRGGAGEVPLIPRPAEPGNLISLAYQKMPSQFSGLGQEA